MIKLYNISHAVEIIFDENLIIEFEQEFGEIGEGGSFSKHIRKNGITLEQFTQFLTDYTKDEHVTKKELKSLMS